MRILSQNKRGIAILENQDGICIHPSNQERKIYEISADRMELGRYSSLEKAKIVLQQIFEHTGETFIMPQDEEVEV